MDTTAAIVVLVPIFMPTLSAYGIDKVHFGVMMTLNLMIGLLTPAGRTLYLPHIRYRQGAFRVHH